MLAKSEFHSHYKREYNILIEVLTTGEEKPVVKFKQHFIDASILNECSIDYLNRYIKMFPHLIGDIATEIEKQLTLF